MRGPAPTGGGGLPETAGRNMQEYHTHVRVYSRYYCTLADASKNILNSITSVQQGTLAASE